MPTRKTRDGQINSERQCPDTQGAPERSSVDRTRTAGHDSDRTTDAHHLRGVPSLSLSPQALGVLLCAGLLVIAGWTAIPAGAQSGPTEISDWTDLQAIDNGAANLSDDYVLVNDLDRNTAGYDSVVLNQTDTFTETISIVPGETQTRLTRAPVDEILSVDDVGGDPNLTLVDPATGTIERSDGSSVLIATVTYTTQTEQFVGFDPIASSRPFTGSLDGQGHNISDLAVYRPSRSAVGLFGNSRGTIESVTLTNVSINNSDGRSSNTLTVVGGLVGSNNGTVSNVSVSGSVTAEGTYAGGLVGSNIGTVSDSSASGTVVGSVVGSGGATVGGLVGNNGGTMSSSSASSTVTTDGTAGGLVGENTGGAVRNSFASGSVTSGRDAGGLVGINYGTVTDSYALGSVTGEVHVGGLVGRNGISFASGSIQRTYAVGAVESGSEVGGLVGEHRNGSVTDSYFDSAATAIGVSGSNATTSNVPTSGLTTDAMQGLTPTQTGEGTMDGLAFARGQSGSDWVAVVAGEEIGPVPQQDGYPIVQSIDTAEQLRAQGIDTSDHTDGDGNGDDGTGGDDGNGDDGTGGDDGNGDDGTGDDGNGDDGTGDDGNGDDGTGDDGNGDDGTGDDGNGDDGTGDDGSDDDGSGDGNGDDGSGDGNGDDGSGDGSGPGFGPGAVLVGLSGVGYLLKRRLNTDEADSS